jgi:hypothetical protein
MGTNPYYFSAITYRSLSFADLVSTYATWALGLDGQEEVRSRRLADGADPSWSVEQVSAGDDLRGAHACRLQSRRHQNLFLLRLEHSEPGLHTRLWTSCIRITAAEQGTLVEHGVVISDPGNQPLPPVMPPRVVSRLLQRVDGHALPKELHHLVVDITADSAEDFLGYVLMDRDRALPMLVTTPTNQGVWHLPVEVLARRVVGLAAVHRLVDVAAVRAFNQALDLFRFDPRMGVSDGAVRYFDTGLTPTSSVFDHPLWTEERCRLSPGIEPLEFVTIAIARRRLPRAMPVSFPVLIEEFDRAARHERLGALSVEAANDRAILDIALADNRSLTEEVARLTRQVEEEILARQVLEERFAEERAALDARAQVLEAAANRPITQRHTAGNTESRHLLRALANPEKATLHAVLQAMGAAYPDAVVILPEALRSAEESHDFRYPDAARDLLCRLLTTYRDTLARGRSDQEAKGCFGQNEFAANEAAALGTRGERLRTFLYQQRPVLMLRHLRHGVGEGSATCLRIHFHWDAEAKKIVIGHCGRHLDFS